MNDFTELYFNHNLAHPEANHNIGVRAVSVNKTDTALPIFKNALENNPKIEQFWLSYVNVFVKDN